MQCSAACSALGNLILSCGAAGSAIIRAFGAALTLLAALTHATLSALYLVVCCRCATLQREGVTLSLGYTRWRKGHPHLARGLIDAPLSILS